MDELSSEFQELDVINPHEQDQYNVLRENCKRYREALEEIVDFYSKYDEGGIISQGKTMKIIAQQALDEVSFNSPQEA